jgi:hypothetical protein
VEGNEEGAPFGENSKQPSQFAGDKICQ